MASFFQSSVDVERAKQADATASQRFALYRLLKVITYPQYKEDDKHGNKAGDICLPIRHVAELNRIPWLSKFDASMMLETLNGNSTAEEKEVVRQKLLSYCQGNADRRSAPKVEKNVKFQALWDLAIAAGKTAAETAPETDESGIVAINVAPGTVGFARWLKEAANASPSVFGGLDIMVKDMPFSKAVAYGEAVVQTLRKEDTGLTKTQCVPFKLNAEQVAKLRHVETAQSA